MRLRIKIILAVAASLLIAAHFLLWVYISQKGPEILQKSLSHHLGYELRADRVKFSLLSQSMVIKNFYLTDPARPKSKPFFAAKRVTIQLNLFALFRRQIRIRKISILSPSLSVWRNRQGVWMFPPQRQKNEGSAPASGQKTPLPANGAKDARSSFFEIVFQKLDVRKGEVRLGDETLSPPLWVRLRDIRVQGRFLSPTALEFSLSGQIETRNPANFTSRGDGSLVHGNFNCNITTTIDKLDIALLAPYYQPYSPAVIAGGRIGLRSEIHCKDNILGDSTQTITLRDLKIKSWDEKFLQENTVGIPNKNLADYLAANSRELAMDFSISGPLEDLQSLGTQDVWKKMGSSAVDQWFNKKKEN